MATEPIIYEVSADGIVRDSAGNVVAGQARLSAVDEVWEEFLKGKESKESE